MIWKPVVDKILYKHSHFVTATIGAGPLTVKTCSLAVSNPG